jgi:hypothetical protein
MMNPVHPQAAKATAAPKNQVVIPNKIDARNIPTPAGPRVLLNKAIGTRTNMNTTIASQHIGIKIVKALIEKLIIASVIFFSFFASIFFNPYILNFSGRKLQGARAT